MPEAERQRAAALKQRLHPALVTAALAYAVIAQGAFYPEQALILAGIAAAAAATSGGRLPRLVWAAFGVLAAGIATAMILQPSGDPRIAISILVISTSGTLIGEAHTRRGEFGSILIYVLGVGALASLLGLVGAAWHLEPLALEAQGIWRAASTLTYANSLGAILVPCLAAGAWLLARDDRLHLRLGVAAVTAGLVASISRAAFVSLALGLLIAAIADRRELMRALRASLVPILAGAVAGASALPAILGDPAPIPVLIGALVAVSLCMLADPARVRGMVPMIAAGALVAAGVGIAVAGAGEGLGTRLLNEDRARIWEVSYEAGVQALPEGQGLSRFAVYEQRHGRTFLIRFAHNEMIQVFVEAGWVGLASKGVAIILFAAALLPRRRNNALALGVAMAFLVHGLLDFVWHVAAYVLLAFLWVGSILATREGTVVEG